MPASLPGCPPGCWKFRRTQMIKRFIPARSAQAKGRNGYFKVGQIQLWRDAYDGALNLDVVSTRPGKAAPCRIELAPADAIQLARLILNECCDTPDDHGETSDA